MLSLLAPLRAYLARRRGSGAASPEINSRLALRWRLDLLRGGKVIPMTAWRDNLITDAGLDAYATAASLLSFLAYPIIGENASPTPVRRDSGATTLSQSGNTVTASGNFFVAADVGRLIKYGTGDTGAECYISGYTSATVVTVSTSATVAAQTATVWYVNTAAILTPITGLTWSPETGAANNYSTPTVAGDVCTVTHQTVLVSSAFTVAKTITEIAFTNNGTNAAVFDRDVIQPGAAASIGDQARVTVQLVTLHSGVTVAAQPNVGTGFSTAGTVWLESLGIGGSPAGFSSFSSSGGISGSGYYLEPSVVYPVTTFTADFSPAAFSATTPRTLTGAIQKNVTVAGYGTGTHYRDATVLYAISESVGTVYGFAIGSLPGGKFWFVKFTTPVPKAGTQTLSFTIRKSWSRVLTN